LTQALPSVVRDPRAQDNFDALNGRLGTAEGKFPVGPSDLSAAAKELFLQLAAAGVRKINFGEAETSHSASETATVEVEHGLGVVPIGFWPVLYTNSASAGGAVILRTEEGYTSTKVKLLSKATIAGTYKVKFKWIAIG
jgi:hypothetical protein